MKNLHRSNREFIEILSRIFQNQSRMPFCCECCKGPTPRGNNKRTINPSTKQCNKCTEKLSSNSNSTAVDGMNSYFEEYRQNVMGEAASNDDDSLNEDMMTKSVSELTVRDILRINIHANKPIAEKLDGFINQMSIKIASMDKRIEFLEAERVKKDEDNATLKKIIRNMQRSLNKSDSDIRNRTSSSQAYPKAILKQMNIGVQVITRRSVGF